METVTNPPRLLKPEELGAVVKFSRELRKWSQEQLAEIAGVSTRTVQRLENGNAVDFNTKRALAGAFGFEDIDALNKPFKIPTADELMAAQEAFERDHITLKAFSLSGGRELAELATHHPLDLCTPGFDMERQAEELFAALVDYVHEYRDCAELYSEITKLEVYDQLQEFIDGLSSLRISLRYAVRDVPVKLKAASPAKPVKMTALYLVTFPLGEEPEEFVTPREVDVRW